MQNNIKFLAFGDIVGRTGRQALKKALPELREHYQPDFVIANGENLAHGKGVTEKTLQEIRDIGVDIVTSGNHIWDKKEVIPLLQDKKIPLLRPLNYPSSVPGMGYWVFEQGVNKILVINVMGRVFMGLEIDDPFRGIDQLLKELGEKNFHAIIIDVHAEATSEKSALGHFLDGRVSCVFGTHTHIPTADERILKGGTAYISDIGMIGARDSVIGVDKQTVINKFLTQLPTSLPVVEGTADLSGIFVEIDPETKKATHIERIQKIVEM